jgi:putative redox protein
MELKITFPGGKKVNAEVRGWTIATDQPREVGGEGSAPEPYALFAASIGTCAGFYALTFCQSRGLSTEGLAIRQRMRFEEKRLVAVELDIDLPKDFPEKYREPLIRAADGCAVKKAILAMPEIVVRTVPAATAEVRA